MRLQDYKTNLTHTLKALDALPHAPLDSDTSALKEAFEIAYGYGLFGVYKIDDGDHQAHARFELFVKLTPYSGALVFLGIQILAANSIMQRNHFPRSTYYFGKRCGIAINHLRANRTIVSATACEGGYCVSGRLSWASGYGIFDTLLVGFHHEGYEYMAMMPFEAGESIRIGSPAQSFAGNAMATVDIVLDGLFIPQEDIVAYTPIGSYTRAKSISKTVHIAIYSLGVAAIGACSDSQVAQEGRKRLERLRDRFLLSSDGEEMDRLRIELFGVVQEIITTAMVLYGGRSILIQEHLQRYYRELIMFNANGLNATIKGLFKERFLC